MRFINAIIETPTSLLVRARLRGHFKSLKIPEIFNFIFNDFDSEDIKKQIVVYFDSSKLEEESFQEMNSNHIK